MLQEWYQSVANKALIKAITVGVWFCVVGGWVGGRGCWCKNGRELNMTDDKTFLVECLLKQNISNIYSDTDRSGFTFVWSLWFINGLPPPPPCAVAVGWENTVSFSIFAAWHQGITGNWAGEIRLFHCCWVKLQFALCVKYAWNRLQRNLNQNKRLFVHEIVFQISLVKWDPHNSDLNVSCRTMPHQSPLLLTWFNFNLSVDK